MSIFSENNFGAGEAAGSGVSGVVPEAVFAMVSAAAFGTPAVAATYFLEKTRK